MTQEGPSKLLLQQVFARRTEATQQLERAQHETMKDQLQFALRDLEEAELWLSQPNIDSRPSIQQVVRLILELAGWRINIVKDALDKFGPDAMMMGD
jgi:hypothetical protein